MNPLPLPPLRSTFHLKKVLIDVNIKSNAEAETKAIDKLNKEIKRLREQQEKAAEKAAAKEAAAAKKAEEAEFKRALMIEKITQKQAALLEKQAQKQKEQIVS